MKRSDELLGLAIYSISEGIELGRSKDLIINAAAGQVEGIIVQDQHWMEGIRVLPFSLVEGIGQQAITVEHSASIQGISDLPDMSSHLAMNIRVRGTKVIARNGDIRGIVSEYLVDTTSGVISGCEVQTDEESGNSFFVEAENVLTFGRDALVIRESSDPPSRKPSAHIPPAVPVKPAIPTPPPVQKPAPPKLEIIEPVSVVAPIIPESVEETVDVSEATNELTNIFDERQKQFLLGKRSTRRVETDRGVVLVEEGETITEEIITKSKLAGKYIELTMSI